MVTDPSDRPSVKLRRILFRKNSAEVQPVADVSEEIKKHEFYVLKMSWDQAIDAISEVEEMIQQDDFLNNVTIRNIDPVKDQDQFVRLYNRAFITAPDPYRSISKEDIKHFNSQSTFVAVLWGQLVGFIFLTIEPLIKQSIEVGRQGVIAGVGVDPRYRRKKIAFLLASHAANFFSQPENNVDELVCEVYHLNKVSYSFIKNFGMTRTGTVYI
jgi:ribosomal protein S18 acetylase RimI-like enzyme